MFDKLKALMATKVAKEAKEKLNDWVNEKIEILGMDDNTEKKFREKIVKKLNK